MAQKITSNAAQSAAANSSLEELIKQLKEENAALKRELEEKDKKLQAAIKEKRNLQNRLRDWKRRSKKIEAVKPTVQSKTEQVKPAVASTKKEAVIKPTKAEPIVQSTKNDTTTSPAPRSSDRAIAAPEEESAKLNAWAYKREVLIPNLISNIEKHYGAEWKEQWSQDVEEKLDKMDPPKVRNLINALNLHKSYYESNSKEFADVVDEWPNTADELYHKIMENKHDDNKEQGN